jgi:DNA-binding IclR family transcriptional regulator
MAAKSYESPAVRKAINLIELLCDQDRPLGLTEISQELDLNKHMVLRLLSTLEDTGWVVKHPEGPKYSVGMLPFHHTSKVVRRTNLRSASEQPLRALWQETGESTFLSVLYRGTAMLVEHLDGVGSIRVGAHVGERYPLNCTAAGKALLAFGGSDLLAQAAERGFERPTPNSLCTMNELRGELERIREAGYALDREESITGVVCLGAPVFDHAGQLAGVVGLTVFSLAYTMVAVEGQLALRVVGAAAEISQALGWPGRP